MTFLYRILTRFAVVKTGFKNIYRSSTSLQIWKLVCPTSAGSSQNCLVQAFNRLGGSQNVHDNPSQTFNRCRSSQNMHHNLLHAFNRLCGSQNFLAKPLRAFNRHCSRAQKCNALFGAENVLTSVGPQSTTFYERQYSAKNWNMRNFGPTNPRGTAIPPKQWLYQKEWYVDCVPKWAWLRVEVMSMANFDDVMQAKMALWTASLYSDEVVSWLLNVTMNHT